MEEKREKVKHSKVLLDSHFATLFEEMDGFTDDDILEEVFQMANVLFSLAEEFGYREFIEREIYKSHPDKL